MTRKLLCTLLAIFMLIGVLTFGASAQEDTDKFTGIPPAVTIHGSEDVIPGGSGMTTWSARSIAASYPNDAPADVDTVEEKVDWIAEKCRESGVTEEWEIALWLHDWLIYNANYDYTFYYYHPDGVLLNGTGVCQSYAEAYALLLDEFGIENIFLASPEMNHAWNLVKIDGEWCHVDCTWDDPNEGGGYENHNYFGMTDKMIGADHIWNTNNYLPCTSKINYYPVRMGYLVCKTKEEYFAILDEQATLRTNEIDVYYVGGDPNFSMLSYYLEWLEDNISKYNISGYGWTDYGIRLTARLNYWGGHTHYYQTLVIDPTCTEDGYTEYYCSCGDTFLSDYVEALGHDYDAIHGGVACKNCNGMHPNTELLKGKIISVMGDSISTFGGWIPVADGFNEGHAIYYTPGVSGLSGAEDTWWLQTINALGAKLGVNESWSGSKVTGGGKSAMVSETRIRNMGSNGTPDIILFYGATNDIGHLVTLGTFTPENAREKADFGTTYWDNLADAYAESVLRMQEIYPDAQIIAMLPAYASNYYTAENLDRYNSVLAAICEYYGISYIDLRVIENIGDYQPDKLHPNAQGMDLITDVLLDVILDECGNFVAGANVVYPVEHIGLSQRTDSNTLNTASKKYFSGISAGTKFEEQITVDEDKCLTITMAGKVLDDCYKNGVLTIECVTGAVSINADEHSYGSGWETNGQTHWKKCANCAKLEEAVHSDAANDKDHACDICGRKNVTEHSYVSTVSNPTCTEQGYTTHTCSCGDSYVDTYVDALDHNWDEGVVTKEPTEDAAGEKTYTCDRCKTQKIVSIPALGHTHDYITIETKPTCTATGYTTYTCKCGDSFTDSEVEALGHDWGNWLIETAGSCTVGAVQRRDCLRCGEFERNNLDAPGHDYEAVVTPPTATEQGYTTHTCTNCGDRYVDNYVDPFPLPTNVNVELARMILGNELAMQFAFKQELLVPGADYSVVITKSYADGRDDKIITVPQDQWKSMNVSGVPHYYVSFNGIAAKEMCDTIHIQLMANGNIPIGQVYTDSIRDYALRQLRTTTNPETRTLYVDMLNYGAAAQTYFKYNADALVNAELTATEKSYGTKTVSLVNNRVPGTGYVASQLNLASSIQLRLKFNGIDASMYAVASFTNHMGNQKNVTIPGSEFISGGTVVVVNDVVAADYDKDVTITVYDAQGNAVANAVESVASYIARMTGGSEIYEAVAKYCSAAYGYLHRND